MERKGKVTALTHQVSPLIREQGIPLLEGCVTSSERVVEAIKGS